MSQSRSHLPRIIIIALLVLVAGGALGVHLATRALRTQIVRILGPHGEAAHIDVGFSKITLDDVRIKAPAGWPAAEALRARRITLEPDLWKLLSHRVVIRHALVEDAYLSLLRTQNGKISLLPDVGTSQNNAAASDARTTASASAASAAALSETPTAAGTPASTRARYAVDVGQIDFRRSTLDFFDASVSAPPHRLNITNVTSRVGNLHFPTVDLPTQVSITGDIASAAHTGHIDIHGWINFKRQDSDIQTTLTQVDIESLRPYIERGGARFIQSGLVSLGMHSVVHNQQLDASGTITLDSVQLAPAPSGSGPLAALAALPRSAAVAALKDRQNRIALDFTLNGNLSDPHFSLNEGIAVRIAAGLAKTLGVSTEGVARSAGDATRGLGGALLNLIGK